MRAIVVCQPWATLIALGVKTIETRPSPPNGPMRPDGVRGLPGCSLERGERTAIVAGATKPKDGTRLGKWSVHESGSGTAYLRAPAHRTIYGNVGFDEYRLPLCVVVCTAVVTDALPICGDSHDDDFGLPLVWNDEDGRGLWLMEPSAPHLPDMDPERSTAVADQLPLGDFTPGRWGWLLDDVAPTDPIPCKGRQGVFRLPDDVAAQIGGGS